MCHHSGNMSCRVRAVQSSACLMSALGLLPARPDLAIGAAHQLVPCKIGLRSASGPSVDLGAPDGLLMPLGHQDTVDGCRCPIEYEDELEDAPPLSLRLAAVAIAIDSRRRVLLTRRPRSMSTFPGAWVLPGGSVDVTDTSLVCTALRELEEETGLRASLDEDTLPLCFWESCYPVTYEGWRGARSVGKRVAHSLIAFIVVPMSDEVIAASALRLQPDECDAACWVPLDDVAGTLCIRAAGAQDGAGSNASGAEAKLSTDEAGAVAGPPKRQRTGEDGAASSSSYPCALSTADGLVEHGTIKADCLTGVYPNVCGEGVGRGHCFALRQLLLMSDGS